MDNFHCACYCCWSEPKGKGKNNFDNIICNGVLVLFYESARILIVWAICLQVTNNGDRGEINGHDLWEKVEIFRKSEMVFLGVMGSLHHYSCHYSALNSNYYSFKNISPFLIGENHTHNLPWTAAVDQEFYHIEPMTSKVQSTSDYWTIDVKMTSKVQPAADYWIIDVKGYWTIDRENLDKSCVIQQREKWLQVEFISLSEENILNE